MSKNYDFLGIGDTVTDAFIKLKEAHINCKPNHEDCEISMRFGDKIPYEDVFVVPGVGNSANACVAASRLGLKSALLTNLGKDRYGEECLAYFKKEKVNTSLIKLHKNIKTNYHYVLWYKDDRTILIKHEKYPYSLPNIGSPKWVYFSSLGQDAEIIYPALEEYFKKHPEVNLVFQPGTYQLRMGVEKLEYFYKRSKVFICNKEESQSILNTKEADIKKLLKAVHDLGPEIVCITDGHNGSYVLNNNEFWFMPIYPDPKPPLERTGAGDAFSSTFISALILGKSIDEALMWGPINSMSVVQKVGSQAGLLTRHELEDLLAKAPKDYFPKKI